MSGHYGEEHSTPLKPAPPTGGVRCIMAGGDRPALACPLVFHALSEVRRWLVPRRPGNNTAIKSNAAEAKAGVGGGAGPDTGAGSGASACLSAYTPASRYNERSSWTSPLPHLKQRLSMTLEPLPWSPKQGGEGESGRGGGGVAPLLGPCSMKDFMLERLYKEGMAGSSMSGGGASRGDLVLLWRGLRVRMVSD